MLKRKILIIVLVLLLFINVFAIKDVYADDLRLEDLDINVFINEDGSARIREKRKMDINEGTENYLVIGNLGNSTIEDFVVTENGRVYEYIDDWDIDRSREEKMYRNGLIDTGDGYELSWGIGEYGRHDYIVEYTITNFIKELEDSQILFWRFVNDDTNVPPENLRVTIESDTPFSEETEQIYAFGYEGDIQFVDGKVVAKNSQALDSSDYVTILMGLPSGLFLTGDYVDKTFEEIQEEALEGSDYGLDYGNGYDPYYDSDYESESSWGLGSLIAGLFPLLIIVFGAIGIIATASSSNIAGSFKRKYKEEYYRDYPYEGEFLDLYHILYKIGLGTFENLLTAFILKWINEERIMTETEEAGFFKKRDQTNIRFLSKEMDRGSLEGELFHMMLDAAGSNQILEEKEFTNWAGRNSDKIERWEEKVKENSSLKLQDLGYLEMEEKKVLFFKTHNLVLTSKGEELEGNIYKYINYLYDFSLLNEHEAINVKIWDNIMIWAAVFGITEVVSKQLEKLYPRYQTETIYRGNSIYLAHALTRNVARAAVPPDSSIRSGGGGGFSSGGGGGGSFGGGSGGGVR